MYSFLFVELSIEHLWAIIFFAISGSLLLSQLGIITGIWSEKFDHLGTITNFIIVPLSFLSGTFYSVERMPGFARVLIDYNPFFYIIDGFRYGFIGASDSSVIFGVYFITFLNIGMWVLNFYLIKKRLEVEDLIKRGISKILFFIFYFEENMNSSIMNTYNRYPVSFKNGKGSWLTSEDGKKFLDFSSGIAVNILGHNHTEINKTFAEQANKIWHVSNLYNIPEQELLAKKLCELSFADKSFLL